MPTKWLINFKTSLGIENPGFPPLNTTSQTPKVVKHSLWEIRYHLLLLKHSVNILAQIHDFKVFHASVLSTYL